ncbi:hypothetical protein M3223_08665 [Paenibacillus pasadenensis]|uniref:hypothetical protein n=1 Tax=Paenibacillus pasadenensis TaxID=217090 RepID=UPI00203A4CF9|nr:hypothetical protein [Paenibacillus pasadenensis]MCM3747425.1 hypothetical protein [Paenibacillus pasadenensis]
MSHIVPIQITLQAATAIDARQLVLDLAGTLHGMPPTEIPARTDVSTVSAPPAASAPVTPAAPVNPAPIYPPTQQAPMNGGVAPAGYPPAGVPIQTPPAQVPMQQPPAGPPAGVPVSAPAYSLDQLGQAAGPLLDAGRGPELVGWLQQRGAGRLDQLNPQLYGEFATYLRSLGAQI